MGVTNIFMKKIEGFPGDTEWKEELQKKSDAEWEVNNPDWEELKKKSDPHHWNDLRKGWKEVENGNYEFHKTKNGSTTVTVVTDRPTALNKERKKLTTEYWKANRKRFKKEIDDAIPKILELASEMP